MKFKLLEPVSKRQAAAVVVIVVSAILLGWGGWVLYGRLTGRPQSVAQMKQSIRKYLAKQGRGKGAQTPLDLSTATLTEAVPVTNKAGRVRAPGKARNNLDLPDTTLTDYFRTNQAAAPSYEVMYRYIGQQLRAADELLSATNEARQLAGLVLACEAGVYARTNAQNLWLGARICEAYLWPQLSLIEGTNRTSVTEEAVLNLCDIAFKEANETNHVIQNYEFLIARADRPQAVDNARFRLALIYMERQENAKALKLLKSLKTLKTAKIARDIAKLETLVPDSQK